MYRLGPYSLVGDAQVLEGFGKKKRTMGGGVRSQVRRLGLLKLFLDVLELASVRVLNFRVWIFQFRTNLLVSKKDDEGRLGEEMRIS